MNTSEARALGAQIAELLGAGKDVEAIEMLALVLAGRAPFRLLDVIGDAAGTAQAGALNRFLEQIASARTMGGWVVIASALRMRLDQDMDDVFARCKGFVVEAGLWYATDTLGERVPGPALLMDFDRALGLFSTWRADANPWVRRTCGVAAHFWAKRTRGAFEQRSRASDLLSFLEPMFEERNIDALKGVGWGLKSLARYYPDLAVQWLETQMVQRGRRPGALMVRKALTYLPPEMRARALGKKP